MFKNFLFSLILSVPIFAFAQDPSAKSISDKGDNTKISLYIPGFMMKAGSWCVNKEKDPVVKEMLGKMRSVSICIREGNAYQEFLSEKYTRKMEKLRKQNFEEWMNVKDDDDKVSIQSHQNRKGKIRQVVIMSDDGSEEFVFLRLRCNLYPEDLQRRIRSRPDLKNSVTNLVDL